MRIFNFIFIVINMIFKIHIIMVFYFVIIQRIYTNETVEKITEIL